MDQDQTSAAQDAVRPSVHNDKRKLIIIVVAVVILGSIAWIASSRFTAERIIERAIEQSGAGTADVEIGANGQSTVTVTGEDGTRAQYAAGANVTVPADWPTDVPVMDGLSLTYAGTSNPQTGEQAYVVTGVTASAAADVIAYYKNALAAQGWAEATTMNTVGTSIYAAQKDNRQAGVYVMGDDTGTTVTISVSES